MRSCSYSHPARRTAPEENLEKTIRYAAINKPNDQIRSNSDKLIAADNCTSRQA